MPKRLGRPTRARTTPITPLTKGAGVPPHTRTPLQQPNFPFAIPPVRPSSTLSEEERLYSQPPSGRAPMSTKPQLRGNADAARARMMGGGIPDDAEVDSLGEADVIGDAQQYEPEQEQEYEPEPPEDDARTSALREEIAQLRETMSKMQAGNPTAAPSPAPAAAPAFLDARLVMIEDADRLWDWVRADAHSGHAFFGLTFATSMALHSTIRSMQQAEANGVGMLRAIHTNHTVPQHIGFVMLAPIMADERLALAHVYLRADLRGRLQQLLPALLQLAAQEMPNFKIGVLPADLTQQRLYRALLAPLGFTEHTVFVR